jgi:hypothetical protein
MRGMMGGGLFGGGDTTISTGDLKRYEDRLTFTDDQRAAARTLLEGYRAELKTVDDETTAARQAAMEKFRESRDPAIFEGVRTAGEEATKRKVKAESDFLGDVKSLLTPEQEPKWDGVERMRRRDVGLRRGRLTAERLDVVKLVDDLKLESKQQAGLADILGEYELAVDRELAARNKVYEEVGGKIGELMRNQDMDGAQKELELAREAGLKVREINKKFARQVMEALPADQKAVMALAVKKASHPEIYNDSLISKQLAAAELLSGLDETQKKSITELREKHAREIGGVNDQLAAAAEANELTMSVQDIMGRFRGQPGPGEDLRSQRSDLESAAAESLKKILTPEQMGQLPRPEPRGQGGRGGRRGQPQNDNADEGT